MEQRDAITKDAEVPQMTRDPVVEAVRSKLRERSERGLTKYGVSVADAALSREQWLIHAQEEALDLAIYLEKCLSENAPKSANESGASSLNPTPSVSAVPDVIEEANAGVLSIEGYEFRCGDKVNLQKGENVNLVPPLVSAAVAESVDAPDSGDICQRCGKDFGFSGEDANGFNSTCVHCGNNTFEAALGEPRAVSGLRDVQGQMEVPRIYSRCWACNNSTLTIHDGHLLCTWIDCPNPILMHTGPAPSVPEAPKSDAVVGASVLGPPLNPHHPDPANPDTYVPSPPSSSSSNAQGLWETRDHPHADNVVYLVWAKNGGHVAEHLFATDLGRQLRDAHNASLSSVIKEQSAAESLEE